MKAGQELPAKDQKVATGVISLTYKDDEKKILLQILDFVAGWGQASKQYLKWTKMGATVDARLENDSLQSCFQTLLREYSKVFRGAAALQNVDMSSCSRLLEMIQGMCSEGWPADVTEATASCGKQWGTKVAELQSAISTLTQGHHLPETSWAKKLADPNDAKLVLDTGSTILSAIDGDAVDAVLKDMQQAGCVGVLGVRAVRVCQLG